MHWDHFFSDLQSRVLVSRWDALGLEYVIRAEPLLAEDGSSAWVLGSLAERSVSKSLESSGNQGGRFLGCSVVADVAVVGSPVRKTMRKNWW